MEFYSWKKPWLGEWIANVTEPVSDKMGLKPWSGSYTSSLYYIILD